MPLDFQFQELRPGMIFDEQADGEFRQQMELMKKQMEEMRELMKKRLGPDGEELRELMKKAMEGALKDGDFQFDFQRKTDRDSDRQSNRSVDKT